MTVAMRKRVGRELVRERRLTGAAGATGGPVVEGGSA
jgi:hypothetical protein